MDDGKYADSVRAPSTPRCQSIVYSTDLTEIYIFNHLESGVDENSLLLKSSFVDFIQMIKL